MSTYCVGELWFYWPGDCFKGTTTQCLKTTRSVYIIPVTANDGRIHWHICIGLRGQLAQELENLLLFKYQSTCFLGHEKYMTGCPSVQDEPPANSST